MFRIIVFAVINFLFIIYWLVVTLSMYQKSWLAGHPSRLVIQLFYYLGVITYLIYIIAENVLSLHYFSDNLLYLVLLLSFVCFFTSKYLYKRAKKKE